MLHCLKEWTYTKHTAAVSSLYLGTALVGNTVLASDTEQGKRKQRIFNGIVAGCFLFDMSATYLLLKALRNRLEEQESENR